jgi:AhpD family alkylhydroperoxidase
MTANPAISYESFKQIAPDAYKALIALGKSVEDGGLDKKLTELVKIRVSQIDGCAFCLKLHLDIARRLKIDQAKLDLVAVWLEAGCFDAREMAALEWAEHLTAMNGAPVPDDAYAGLNAVFSEAEAAFLTVTIANINAWNRIAGALRFAPL